MIPTSTFARRQLVPHPQQQHQQQRREDGERESKPASKPQVVVVLVEETDEQEEEKQQQRQRDTGATIEDNGLPFTYAQKKFRELKAPLGSEQKESSTANSQAASTLLVRENVTGHIPVKRPRVTVKSKRCIALVDLDCFFVAVERMLDSSLLGIPVAVGQYTQGSTLIAVSYEAKAKGVKRGMFGFQATKVCPDLRIVKVQVKNDKADLSKYRDASSKVLAIASRYCPKIERASVDEFYLDLSDVVEHEEHGSGWGMGTLFCDGYDHISEKLPSVENEDLYLAAGCRVVAEIRQAIKTELGLTCSAGIAENKFLAKSIAGIRKPDTQICLRSADISALCADMPINKAKSLGGKLGVQLKETFNIEFLGELNRIGEAKLCGMFGAREGKRLAALAKGMDDSEVESRVHAKSLGCSKTFPGPAKLTTRQEVSEWIVKLSNELIERLEKDGRRPTTVTIGAHELGTRCTSNCTLEGNKFTVASLSSIAETLFDRLVDAKDFDQVGGVQSLSLNLSGFPEPDSTTFAAASFWQCAQCTFENESIWLKCEACGFPKSGMTSSLAKVRDRPVSHVSTDGPLKSFLGSSSSSTSSSANRPKPVSEVEVINSDEVEEEHNAFTKITQKYEPRNSSKPNSGTWTCRKCTFAENDVRFLRCDVCQAFKGL